MLYSQKTVNNSILFLQVGPLETDDHEVCLAMHTISAAINFIALISEYLATKIHLKLGKKNNPHINNLNSVYFLLMDLTGNRQRNLKSGFIFPNRDLTPLHIFLFTYLPISALLFVSISQSQ